ncbi:MAG: DUF1236 domain-containing protein [Proteobacteria bacterium]|nr:DUF1236 domain-containing protein [Pseudomonadota bacterium]
MTNRFLLSVAAAALIAGTSLANAQGTGGTAPAAGPGAQQSAPTASTPMNRGESSESGGAKTDMNAPRSEDKGMSREGRKHAQEGMKGEKSRNAQDEQHGNKSKSSEMHDRNGDKNMKAEGRNEKSEDRGQMKAEDRNGMKPDSRNAAEDKSSTTTTGQAGAHAKLSTEQRTKITTVIKNEHIRPETHVNFSVSIGTRVPREVHFHPLPAEIVTVYPDWRGYEFFLVRDQIVVVDPHTLEIVAVLEA